MFVSMHGRHPIELDAIDIPIVFCARPIAGYASLSYVDADNRAGASRAVRHLIGSGRRVVATVAGPPDMAPGVDRLKGYRDAVASAHMRDSGLIVYGDFSQASGEHALYRLLDRRPDIEAVFAASDLMAAGVLRALHRTGRKVPDDVAVGRLRRRPSRPSHDTAADHDPPAHRGNGCPDDRRAGFPGQRGRARPAMYSFRHRARAAGICLTRLLS